jgi:SAM-dependent methyltransferase
MIERARYGDERLRRMRVKPGDADYRRAARLEAQSWSKPVVTVAGLNAMLSPSYRQFLNSEYTGNPATSWLDDLVARGPFGHAAVLGCTEGAYEQPWMRAQASEQLDVYELSREVIRRTRARFKVRRLGFGWPDRRVRFIHTDLNFVRLPRDRYDVVWTSSCVHHLLNLEYLLAEVEASLRPGGLLAIQDYVGERRLQYSDQRLAVANELLGEIPARFRRPGMERITRPTDEELTPFEAIRSDEILPLAPAQK